jgi:hypothetical protein
MLFYFELLFKIVLFFFISNFRRVVNVVCFLLGYSLAYVPTFRNTLFHLHRRVGMTCDGLRMLGKRFGLKNSLSHSEGG